MAVATSSGGAAVEVGLASTTHTSSSMPSIYMSHNYFQGNIGGMWAMAPVEPCDSSGLAEELAHSCSFFVHFILLLHIGQAAGATRPISSLRYGNAWRGPRIATWQGVHMTATQFVIAHVPLGRSGRCWLLPLTNSIPSE